MRAPKLKTPAVHRLALGPARFTFRGFAADPGPTLLERFDYVPEGRPPILEYAGALLLPHIRCLYDGEGRRLEPSKVTYIEPGAPAWFNDDKISQVEQASMPAEVKVPDRCLTIHEPVIFLGEVHDHYGHFITDTLARAWALEQFDPAWKVVFAPNPRERLEAPLVRYLLEQAGVPASRILVPDRPARFERLICPVAGLQLSRIYQCLDGAFRGIARRALAAGGAAAPDRPVYLTRTGLKDGLRRLLNEEALEARLEREGYAIVRPEQLGLPEQMALYNGEHPVVMAFGSAMHTVLFRDRPEGQKLGALLPEKVPPRYAMVDVIKGSQAAYLKCMAGEPPDPAGDKPVWSIDPDAAMAGLDAAGFLSRA